MVVPPEPDGARIADLLADSQLGHRHATDQLFALAYSTLHRLAAGYLSHEKADHSLQASALIDEAWLRLAHGAAVDWQGATHFRAIAARTMRRILVDRARVRAAARRGGPSPRLAPTEDVVAPSPAIDPVELHEALEALEALDPRQARVVELRYFGNLNDAEVAAELALSERTVRTLWRGARAWLRARISQDERP